MAGEALVLTFSLTLEDRVDFALLNQRRAALTGGRRKWRLAAMWLVVVLVLLALASLMLPPGPPGSLTGPPGPVLPLLVGGLGLVLLMLVLARLRLRRRSVALNRRLGGAALAEPMAATCTLDDQGFRLETPMEQFAWRWPMLREVAENERHLALITRPAGGFALPKRALTAAQVAAVKAFCAARLAG